MIYFCDSHSWLGWFFIYNPGSIKKSPLSTQITTKRQNPISVVKIKLSEQRKWASIRQIWIEKIDKFIV